jgi:dynein heavy chain
MHANAAITSDINATNALLSVALSLQPRVTSGGGKSRDETLIDLAKGILNELPQ